MVNGCVSLFSLVIFKERKFGDPQKIERILIDQPLLLSDQVSQISQGFINDFRLVSHEENQIIFFHVEFLRHHLFFFI